MKVIKLLYLGYVISKEEASYLFGASVAGNKMQLNILKELEKYKDIELNSITIYPIAAYPKGKFFINRKKLRLFKNFTSLRFGFINIPILKQIEETLFNYLEAKRIVKKEGICKVITFNMFPQVGLPAQWLKKKYGVEIITILADLPIDDTVDRKGLSLFLRKRMDYITKKCLLQCDKVIALNEYAVSHYAPQAKHIIVEGGLDEQDSKAMGETTVINKSIIYTGALVEYSGIVNLMDAMKLVKDSEAVLHVYGSGQLENDVIQKSKEMSNVIYHGRVSNEEIKKIQQSAYLLVNPRPTQNDIAQVTFPSKLFEYLVSGRPVMTTRLNGIGQEYEEYFLFSRGSTPESLAEKINEILTMDSEELYILGQKSREFILQNKSWKKQCKKIYDFIKEEV